MAFALFEETMVSVAMCMCACGRDGSRAYFAHTTSDHTRVFLIFVTSER